MRWVMGSRGRGYGVFFWIGWVPAAASSKKTPCGGKESNQIGYGRENGKMREFCGYVVDECGLEKKKIAEFSFLTICFFEKWYS